MNNTLKGEMMLHLCSGWNIIAILTSKTGVFYGISGNHSAGATAGTIEKEFLTPQQYPGFDPSRVMATADKFIEQSL